MNNKVGIITDSTSYFTKEFNKDNDIYIVNLNVIVDGKSYVDLEEINNEQLFEYADAGKKISTSQPTPDAFLNAMNEMSKNYDEILCFTLSSGLSGTYNSANIAKDMYEGNAKIEVFDTKTSGMGIRACVDKVMELKEQSFDVLVGKMHNFIKSGVTYLTIDDLQTLVNHGRMKASQAMIGNMLRVKPLLTLDEEGKVTVFKKIRTHKKLIGAISNIVSDAGVKKVYVTYIGKKEYALDLFNCLKENIKSIDIVMCSEVGPVLSVPLGRGGLGVFFSKEK